MIEYIDTFKSLPDKKLADFEVINIGYEQCSKGYGYGPHIRPYNLIHFITKGEGRLDINGISFSLKSGDAFIIPAEQVSYYQADSYNPWEYYWIGFTGTGADNFFSELLNATDEHFTIRNIDTSLYAKEIAKCKYLDTVNAANHYMAGSILFKICSLLAEDVLSSSIKNHKLTIPQQVKFYLDAKYTEKIALNELADLFHIHPNYLTRAFKAEYNITPKQYLLNLKLTKATQLLSTTDMPINAIASSLGYEDQLSFSKAFHERFGISPSRYRQLDN